MLHEAEETSLSPSKWDEKHIEADKRGWLSASLPNCARHLLHTQTLCPLPQLLTKNVEFTI